MIDDLAELMEIESLLGEKEPSSPFGKNMRKTLDWFLNKAKIYGMKTGDLDGYCGYAEIGSGKECIGILCHLDVVPAGKGWSYPPFKLTIDDGMLYGRGVVDDKGPTVVILHVLKAINDSNIPLKNRIRLIAGCNEENGSRCLKHYVKNGEIPKMSIVPDSDFPVINSEKGILQIKISLTASDEFKKNIIKIEAGDRPNVVPDSAKAVIKKDSAFGRQIIFLTKNGRGNSAFFESSAGIQLLSEGYKTDDFSIHFFEDTIEIESHGIAGHAMAPDKADNAIFKLISFLTSLNASEKTGILECINNLFCSPLAKERLRIAFSDKKSGALSMNLAAIKYEENEICLTLDLRLPLSAKHTEVIKNIESKLPENSKIEILHFAENLYINEDSEIIKTLLKIYEEVTGEEGYTVQIGGGTYAREMPNAIAFGPTFRNLETRIHNSDECFSVKDFEKIYDIYYKAILALDKI